MRNIEFKKLTPNQIEVRPTDTKDKGKATLILYVDSRSAADILNDTFGPYNWAIEYKGIGNKIFGRLSVWDEEKHMWIFKEDTGSESNIEAEKGQSSDILKRCTARWGCDFLYHTPRIRIDCPDSYYYTYKVKNDRNEWEEREKFSMTFSVREIDWDENKNCTKLVVVDKWGKEVFNLNGKVETQNYTTKKTEDKPKFDPKSKDNLTILTEFCAARKKEEGTNLYQLKQFYDWYKKRLENGEWKNKFMPERLWEPFLAKSFS